MTKNDINQAKLIGGKRKNGHKYDCECHICQNMKNKAKRGGYQEEQEKAEEQKMGGSKKKNGHRANCKCPICKNMLNSKKGGKGWKKGGSRYEEKEGTTTDKKESGSDSKDENTDSEDEKSDSESEDEESESELIVIHNKQKKGLISLICELYSSKIIGNQLVRYIFRNLETAFDSTGIDQYLEYWLALLSTVMDSWIISEKLYLDEQIQYIQSKTIKTMKVKFILDDILDELKKKNYLPSETINFEDEHEKESYEEPVNDEDEDYDESYDPLILSHGEYETTDSWVASLDPNINWDKLLLDLLQFTISEKSELELVKKILGNFISKSVYNLEQIQDKIDWIRSENDFSEYRYYLKDLEELEEFSKNYK